MAAIELRPWRSGDDLALNELWGDPEDSVLGAARTGLAEDSDSPFRRTLVADRDGVPVAAGYVSEATVHPERLWAYTEVAAEERRAGLGARILESLTDEVAASRFAGRRLRAKVPVGSVGDRFASGHGFAVLQRSRMIEIAENVLPVTRPEEIENENLQMQVVATGSVEVTEAFWSWYRRIHQWDPPADLGLGRVNQTFLSDSAGAHSAAVLRRDNELRAFAISYAAENDEGPTELLVGIAEHDDVKGTADDVHTLLGQLAATRPVVVETDDSMGVVTEVMDGLLAKGSVHVVGTPTLIVGN